MRRVGALIALALGLTPAPCRAQETLAPEASTAAVERCASDHETARLLRLEERWLDARAAMLRCADQSCPIAIQSDCSEWLGELSKLIPTLIIVVERDDQSTQPVRLELDGRTLEVIEQLGPVEVLPGKHVLRFTLGSHAPIEREIVLDKGEKNRVIRVRFTRPQAAVPAAPAQSPTAPRLVPARPIPTSTYLLAGGAVAALATSSSLLVATLSSLSAARNTCAPNCKSAEREDIELRLLAVDGLAAAGFILGGLAVYTFVRRPVVYRNEGLAPAIEVGRDRLQLSVEGRF
jgi:hypothetical protein